MSKENKVDDCFPGWVSAEQKKSETWYDTFKRELHSYNEEWSEDEELLEALNDIMEEHFHGIRIN